MTVAVYMQVDRFFPPEIIQRTAIQKWLAQNKIAHSSVQWFIDREAKTEFKQAKPHAKLTYSFGRTIIAPPSRSPKPNG